MAGTSTIGMAGIGIAAAIGFVFALTFFSAGNGSGTGSDGTMAGPAGGNGTIATMSSPATMQVPISSGDTQQLKKFSSISELEGFLQNVSSASNQNTALFFGQGALQAQKSSGVQPPLAMDSQGQAGVESSLGRGASPTSSEPSDQTNPDYSVTNVQVQDVDEPDFMKNDGKYVYILNGDKLTIVDAYPAEQAKIVAKVGLDVQNGQTLHDMFLDGNRLAVFYQDYSEKYVIQKYDFAPYPISVPKTHAIILDVSDKENPNVVRDFEITGSYRNARMIANEVYLVTSSEIHDYNHPIIPRIFDGPSKVISTPDIYYFDNPEQSYSFNTVTSIDMLVSSAGNDNNTGEGDDGNGGNADGIESSTFMMNPSGTIYVSEDSLYITYQKNIPYRYYETHSKDKFFDVIVPLLPQDAQQKIKSIENSSSIDPSDKWDQISGVLQDTYNTEMSESQKNQLFENISQAVSEYESKIQTDALRTVIHRIDISSANGTISYGAEGEVPGRLLNQFSMDENDGRFRIATTSESYGRYQTHMQNNVYVLDKDSLKTIGKLEGIAPDESIYSARFMGDRLYLVTFERTDPFFVIDLSSDGNPKVLGQLKLPGYSNYLHPYDNDHIIGVGKETKENQYGGVETMGVKVALFDVTDLENPKVVDTFEIGKQGTDSDVLWDHKAFLLSKDKNILSIPITMDDYIPGPVPLEDDGSSSNSSSGNDRYELPEPGFWQGFYVFGIDPQKGFILKGTIDHTENGQQYQPNGYGSRSFYIGNSLYTVTNGNQMKINDIGDLHEINKVSLKSTGEIVKYIK